MRRRLFGAYPASYIMTGQSVSQSRRARLSQCPPNARNADRGRIHTAYLMKPRRNPAKRHKRHKGRDNGTANVLDRCAQKILWRALSHDPVTALELNALVEGLGKMAGKLRK